MDIKLFKLDNEQQQSDFWNFIYEESKGYLEMITFWDMCVLDMDTMRGRALADICLEEMEIDRMAFANPSDVFVSDVDMAHKIILEAFETAVRHFFFLSLEYELLNLDEDKRSVTVPFFQDRLEDTNGIVAVVLDENDLTVAFRVIDGDDWRVGTLEDVYLNWKELKGDYES